MVKAASPFLGIEGTVVLRGSSGAVIISLVLGEAAVGIYSAAMQLQMPLRLVGSTIGAGLFPVMVRAFGRGISILATIASRAVELIIAVLLPAAVGLVILADELLAMIYGGPAFAEATVVLRLVAWAGLAMAVASLLGRVLTSAHKELVTLRIAMVNTSFQIFLAVLLTIQFGVVGAAAAYLGAATLNVVQHYVPIRRLFGSFRVWPMVWRPVLATMVMALVLLALGDAPVLALVGIGFAVNLVTLFGVSLWSAGGRGGLRRRWTLGDETEGPVQ
jgi:O-antigen/teichoic acid export membrane protein